MSRRNDKNVPLSGKSRRVSVDSTASSDASTRSTAHRSRAASNRSSRWETQSAASVGSIGRSRRRSVGEDSEVYDDDAADMQSAYSRYSHASNSQYSRRYGYAEEASFLSQGMLGVSRQSFVGPEDSFRSRRSARSGTGGGGGGTVTRNDRRQLLTDDDRVSIRSGGVASYREAGRPRSGRSARLSVVLENERSGMVNDASTSSRVAGLAGAGASRSHVSMDGYVRDDAGGDDSRARRAPRHGTSASAGAAFSSTRSSAAAAAGGGGGGGRLTSTRLHAVAPSTTSSSAGRLRQLLSRAKATTPHGMPNNNSSSSTGSGGSGGDVVVSGSGLFTRHGPLGDVSGSIGSVSNSAATTPTARSSSRHSSGNNLVAGIDSVSSGTRRSDDRLRISAKILPNNMRPTSGGDGGDPAAAAAAAAAAAGSAKHGGKARASKSRGGILSYAHSRLARRPVLAWRQPFRVTAMAATVSGRLFTGGDPNGAIVAWDGRTGAAEYILEGHQAAVLSLELLATQDLLLSGSADRTARLWSLQTLQTLYSFEGHGGLVSCITYAWLEEIESIAFFTGSDDTTVRQWSIERPGGAGGRAEGGVATCVHVFKGHRQPVNALCCVEDATHVISGDDEGIMRVWSTQARKCVATLEAHEGEILAIQQVHIRNNAGSAEDGVAVCIATAGNGSGNARGGSVRLWQANWMHTTVLLAELCVPDLMPGVRCLLTYHHFIFIGGSHGEVLLWDTSSNDVTGLFVFHTQAIRALTLHNNCLCSASFDHHIARWDVVDLLGAEQQTTVPYVPYTTGAFNHASLFLGGSGGATAQTLALLRGSRSSRRAHAIVASSWHGGDGDAAHAGGGPVGADASLAGAEGGGGAGGAAGGPDGSGGGVVGGAGLAAAATRSRRAAAAYELKDISVAEAADAYTELPLRFVLDRLGSPRFDRLFYMNILASIAFCVLFCVLFGLLYPVAEGFFVMAGLEAQLGNFPLPSLRNPRTFFSINSVHWYFRWLDITVQHLWRDRAQTDTYPAISGNNILLSTLRLRVKRVTCNSCVWNPAVITMTDNSSTTTTTTTTTTPDEVAETALCRGITPHCYADWNMPGVRESKIPFLCPMSSTCDANADKLNITALAEIVGVDPHVGFTYSERAVSKFYDSTISAFDRGGFYVDLFYTEDFTAQRQKLAALETLGFVDDVSTRLVDTIVYTYNPNMDLFTMSMFACEVPSAGAWMCAVNSKAFEVYNGKTMKARLACHILLLVATVCIGVIFVLKTVQAVKNGTLTQRLLSFLVWVDAVEFVLMIVITGFFFHWVHLSSRVSVRDIVEVTAANRKADLIARNDLHRDQLSAVSSVYRVFLQLAGIAAIGMSLRVISSFSAISYLRFFADAFRRARPLLLSFALLHTVMLLGFAQAAHLLYGRTMLDYSSLARSFMTLVHRQWGSGDSVNSIEAALTERWASSIFFFFSFNILFVFVALSLLVAIVYQGYTETSKATASIPLSQTLLKRAHDVRYQLRWEALRRTWLLKQLRRCVRRLRRCVRNNVKDRAAADGTGSGIGADRSGAISARGAAQSVVLGASTTNAGASVTSSHAQLVHTQSLGAVPSVPSAAPSVAPSSLSDEDEEDALLEGMDALAERRLIGLLRDRLEEVVLGDAADDDPVGAPDAAGRALSSSVDLSGRWDSVRAAGDESRSPTISSLSANSSFTPGHGGPGTRSGRQGRPNGLSSWTGDTTRGSSAQDLSAMSRLLAQGRRSVASGTAPARSQGAVGSSVLVEKMRSREQVREQRLTTVMVRKTDLAFLLAAIVEEATHDVAHASEKVDMFMDAYSRSFVNHLWEDLAWHYHYVHRSEERQESAAKEVKLRERVESALDVLGPSFALVESAQRQLETQEGHLWPLVQALEQHGEAARLHHNENNVGGGGGERDRDPSGGGGAASNASGGTTRAMYGYSREF